MKYKSAYQKKAMNIGKKEFGTNHLNKIKNIRHGQ